MARRNIREKEKDYVMALSSLLPLPPLIREQLDKTGVIRIATAHLKLRRLFADPLSQVRHSGAAAVIASPHSLEAGEGAAVADEGVSTEVKGTFSAFQPPSVLSAAHYAEGGSSITTSSYSTASSFIKRSEAELNELSFSVFNALEGFILILDRDGKMDYISEPAAVHLGVSQVDMVGVSICSLIKGSDAEMVQTLLALNVDASLVTILDQEINFTLRFDSSMAARRSTGICIDGYKPIHFTGRVLSSNHCRFIGYGRPLTDYGLSELHLSESMFMFRATLALQLIFVDNHVTPSLGYNAKSLLDLSIYKLIHPEDIEVMVEAHKTALRQHQAMSGYYRLLVQGRGWKWAQTKITLVGGGGGYSYQAMANKIFLGITYMLSEREQGGSAYGTVDRVQMLPSPLKGSTSNNDVSTMGQYSKQFYRQINSALS